jgi:hypothetical protein
MRFNINIEKSEGVSFFIALVVVLLPIWILQNFHTGDGPAHLYCAHVLSDLLFDKTSYFHQFFNLNLLPVPNAMIQLLLVPLLLIFSSAIANKVIVTLIIIIFISGYQYMAGAITGKKNYVFTILLLVFCFPLKMGLYSLVGGFGVMLFTMGYYIKHQGNFSKVKLFVLTILITLTWFWHLFACMSLLVLMLSYESILFISHLRNRKNAIPYIKSKLPVLLAFLPVVLLIISFSEKAIDSTATKFASFDTLLEWISDMTVMHFFHTEREGYIRMVFYGLIFISLIVSIFKRRSLPAHALAFVLLSIVITLFLFFLMPLNFFSGGLINLRLSYLALIMACLLIDIVLAGKWLTFFRNGVIVFLLIVASVNVYKNMKPYSERLNELLSLTKHININSVVLPLNYTKENFEYNFCLYLSCDNNCVVMDNAEAASPNGLITWKENVWKPKLIGNYLESTTPLINPDNYTNNTGINIDYIVLWQWNSDINDSATTAVNQLLTEDYVPAFASVMNRARLWKVKPH